MSDKPSEENLPVDDTLEPTIDPHSPVQDVDVDRDHLPGREADPGRFVRTWVWMIVVSGFGAFVVFGSVNARYWELNATATRYVPVERGMTVIDIWRAQVNGLPDVAHQAVLQALFLTSVFGFIGLSVIALWLVSVEVRPGSMVDRTDPGVEDEPSPLPSPTAG